MPADTFHGAQSRPIYARIRRVDLVFYKIAGRLVRVRRLYLNHPRLTHRQAQNARENLKRSYSGTGGRSRGASASRSDMAYPNPNSSRELTSFICNWR
jgi:hypothetical protein